MIQLFNIKFLFQRHPHGAEAAERRRVLLGVRLESISVACIRKPINPSYLKASWERVKVVMGPGLINRKTKEMIAVAGFRRQWLRLLR